ncbi:hypothetical protein EAG_07841 [Camponotus floridanus]|uniref:Uncharacterized protein n=1 Tax=Camponotus floridanus TaxID=104421 RepID=E2AK52_CAMFO|nr:hypothetical protein EAG_07841 [Camponotus floridanus]
MENSDKWALKFGEDFALKTRTRLYSWRTMCHVVSPCWHDPRVVFFGIRDAGASTRAKCAHERVGGVATRCLRDKDFPMLQVMDYNSTAVSKEEKKEEKKEAREQERNNGRLFRKLFSADCRDSSSLSRTKVRTRGGEGVLKRRRKSEYKQNRERKDGEREEEKEEEDMEDEEVEGHCDCLALTFASHILPGCQWHSTGEFSIATSSLCSRTETRYLI